MTCERVFANIEKTPSAHLSSFSIALGRGSWRNGEGPDAKPVLSTVPSTNSSPALALLCAWGMTEEVDRAMNESIEFDRPS